MTWRVASGRGERREARHKVGHLSGPDQTDPMSNFSGSGETHCLSFFLGIRYVGIERMLLLKVRYLAFV